MKLLTTAFWIFLFSIFITGDPSISQQSNISVPPATTMFYASAEMQLRELNSRIKLSRCQLLQIRIQRDLDILGSFKLSPEDIDFLKAHAIELADTTKSLQDTIK